MKFTIVFAAALLSLNVHATPEHDVKPPKPVKAAPVVNVNVSNTVKAVARAPRASSPAPAAAPVAAAPAVPAPEGSQTFVGGSVYERSAPGVAVAAPQQPLKSCRLGFGLGGSNTGGGLGLQIPAGQDQLCLVDAQLELMNRLGGFTEADRLMLVCKVEGMNDTSRCKALSPQPAPASSNGGGLNLLPG